ncbi:MAG: type VI secretion system membrane subunit TssM [Gammaproteobacteria bacterium]|nr:type VI secretion system membrane subunit TssM [Gammaproteobacteria bacterium]
MYNPLQLINKIPGKVRANIVLMLVIFFIVWFVLPKVQIGKSFPFLSIGARLIVLGLIILGFAIKLSSGFFLQHKDKAIAVIVDNLKRFWQMLRTGSLAAWRYSRESAIDLKDRVKQDHKKRRLRRLPWYLVLGAPQAGKKYVIRNSGMYFVKPDYLGEEAVNYINQFPDFDWWFSQQAVMVDAMSYNHDVDVAGWKKFIRLLKRERKNKPLNGIVLTFSMTDLLLYSNKQRTDFLQNIATYIREVHDVFKSQIPVYIVFNKCDLIDGFMEFFDTLSKEELSQVWGMTLPIEDCNDMSAVQGFFIKEYNGLIEQLRKRVMWALDAERSIRGRELINAFPQQMQLFRRPIENFIVELFGAVRYRKALQLRGIYFTSCVQGEGNTQDFLLQAMSKKFMLVPPRFERPSRMGECYFVRNIFPEVVLPEASVLGDSERSKRIKRIAYKSVLTACPLLLVGAGVGMYQGYAENVVNLKHVDQYVNAYNTNIAQLKQGDNSLLNLLPVLDQLNSARNLYAHSKNWGLHTLIASHTVKSDITDAMQRTLHSYYLPRIASQLEGNLGQNIADQNLLYATLKGYLAFSANNYTRRYSIKAPMEFGWNSAYVAHPHTAKRLRYYLNMSLNESIEKLPLNHNLVNRIRNKLEQIIPSRRAYGLLELRASVSNVPDLMVHSEAGDNFDLVFKLNRHTAKISALYTRRGYEKIFLKQYSPIAGEVAEDNKDIGLTGSKEANETASQLRVDLQKEYSRRYLAAWKHSLDGVRVKPFENLNQAIAVLNVLISKESPLPRMLNLIYDNTKSVDEGKVLVAAQYDKLNAYTARSMGDPSWDHTVAILTKLRDYLVKLQQASNQDKASFDAAKSVINGASSDPVQQLTVEAQKSPGPQKRWLLSLANNFWQIIVGGAHNYMNSEWHAAVYGEYNKAIRDRFPLNRASYSSVSMSDFNSFFGNAGLMDVYFNTYIKPFVNTDHKNWQQYKVNGHTIELPQHVINSFARAQKIRDEFFPHGAKATGFDITLKPLTLDSRAASIKVVVGSHILTYSHGPQGISTISWPLSADADDARMVISGFNGDQYVASGSGPWSLFKLFTSGNFKAAKRDGTYYFHVHLHGFSASYRVTGPSDINIFRLTHLRGFKLPSHIA